jgi:putative autotransporter adhesin-like protein
LKAKRAVVGISGSGRAVIAAHETLNANVSGSGSVEYIGDPQVSQHMSGSGSVRRR